MRKRKDKKIKNKKKLYIYIKCLYKVYSLFFIFIYILQSTQKYAVLFIVFCIPIFPFVKESDLIRSDLIIVAVLARTTAAASTSAFGCLLHIAEFALLCKIAIFLETFLSFGGNVLLFTDNTSPFVHHQIALDEKTFGFVRSTIPDLLSRTK